MPKSKPSLVGLCLLCATGLLHAQDCHIALRGNVREEGSETPMPYASVWVKEVGRGAVTDENGYFAIPNLCENTAYTVEVRHLECEHFTQIVRLTEHSELCFHVHHSNTLAEVLVHEKALALRATQAEVTVNQADLEVARGLNLGETLKKLPGVTLLNTGATIAKPIIQGLHSNRISIVSSGVTLESQQWGSEHAPEIDPFAADKISVVKGAAGVRYGVGAMAGAVLLEPAPLREAEGVGGWLSLGGFSNGRGGVAAGAADWHLPGKSLTVRLQGTAKRSGNLHAPQYFLGNTGASELNFSALAGWKTARWQHEAGASRFDQRLGILRAAHVGNLTDLQRAIDSPVPLNNRDEFDYALLRPYQSVQHNTLKYKAVLRISEKWKASGQYSFQQNRRREYDVVRSTGAAASKAQVAFRLWTNTLDAALEHFPIRHWQGGAGAQAVQQTNFVSRGGFIPDYQSFGGGLWAMERWRRFPSPWEVEFGARYDFRQTHATTDGNLNDLDTLVRFGNFSGTAGLIYHAGRHWTLSLNTGQAWRPPHVNELFARGVHHGAGTYEQGNPNLLPERAWNTNLTARFERGGWSALLTLYRNAIRDFIYLNPGLNTVLTVRGAFPAYYYEQTQHAVLQGIDANLTAPLILGFSAEGGLSVLRGHRVVQVFNGEKNRDWLPLMPADRVQWGLKWTRDGGRQMTEGVPHSTYLRLSATTALRQSRIPAEGLLKAAPAGFTVLSFDAAHTFRLRAAARGTTQNRATNPSLDIGLSIQNLTNARYREYLNFFRYYADEPGLNLGLRSKLTF